MPYLKRIKKRGQGATNAATLVALIAALILLYILFLPPEERKELLEGNETGEGEGEGEGGNETLLKENVGRLDFLKRDEYEHDIPAFTLYKTTNSVEIERFNSINVRNSWFDKRTREASFSISDLENTKNVFLTFTATKHKGILIMKLNGDVIFESETGINIEPISLPQSLLKNENKLEFSVSDVGWSFWRTNEYSLTNIKIIGDITDITRQESQNVFHVTSTEVYNAERSTLKFNPDCQPTQVGVLEITLNGYNVFSGVPDCGILNKVDFSPDLLSSGINKIIFKTDKGSYLIDQIKVTTKLKELIYPTYYFDLDREQIKDIQDDDRDLIMRFEFPDDKEDREAELLINGRKVFLETDERFFTKNLDSYAKEGTNYIKIIPKTTLEIVELKVTLG